MKSSLFAIATAILLVVCLGVGPAFGRQQAGPEPKPCANDPATCTGQTAAPASEPAAPPAAAPAQSAPVAAQKVSLNILAELSGGLNVKKLKPGDKIKAQVSQDVLWHGKIIIPEESKLVGHVTEVKRRAPNDPESRLGLVFDRVLLKHHQEVDFQGVVQALSPPAPRRSKVDEPDQMLPPSALTMNQNSAGPMGGVTTGRGTTANATTKSMSIATMPAGVPMYTEANPGSNPGNSVGSGDPKHNAPRASEQKPMSAGMPRGVFGIKGLGLSQDSTTTPGPVIVSNAFDVKLESGTQVLLNVTNPTVRKQ